MRTIYLSTHTNSNGFLNQIVDYFQTLSISIIREKPSDMQAADAYVFVFDDRKDDNKNFSQEVDFALQFGKLTLFVSESDDSSNLPEEIKKLQAVSVITSSKTLTEVKPEVDNFLALLKKHKHHNNIYSNYMLQAVKWTANNKIPEYLLSEHEFASAQQFYQQLETNCPELFNLADWLKSYVLESKKQIYKSTISGLDILKDAFISYNRKFSLSFVWELFFALKDNGFNIWFDQNDIPLGVDYQYQIDEGILKANNFVFILSPGSVGSIYCMKELVQAVKYKKRILPVLHVMPENDDWAKMKTHIQTLQNDGLCDAETAAITSEILGKLNWVYFREGVDDFQVTLEKFSDLLRQNHDYVDAHTRLLAKALKWYRGDRRAEYLLTGNERMQAMAWLKHRFQNEQPPCTPTFLHALYITESEKFAGNKHTKIFLSYALANKNIMSRIHQSLILEAYTVYAYESDVRVDEGYEARIQEHVLAATNIIVLISPDSVTDSFCKKEIEIARKYDKRIIGVSIEKVDGKKVPEWLSGVDIIDMTGKFDNEIIYEEGITQIELAINTDDAYFVSHKSLLLKALNWNEKNKPDSMLLRGAQLENAQAWLKIGNARTTKKPLPVHVEFIQKSASIPFDSTTEVFISFSSTDTDFARVLNDGLQSQGKITWFSQESIAPGTDFQKELLKGIENARNFLFVISPDALQSTYCIDELKYAVRLGKRIVPVLFRQVSVSLLPTEIANIQWIDFTRASEDFNAAMGNLLRALDVDREHIQLHTQIGLKALNWESKSKEASLLLRGKDLDEAKTWISALANSPKNPTPTPLHTEYIETSVKQAKQNRRKLITAAIVLTVVSLLAVVATWQSIVANNLKHEALRIKESMKMISLAQMNLKTNPGFSFAVALNALRLDSNEITSSFYKLYGEMELMHKTLSAHNGEVNAICFSADGKYIFAATWNGVAYKMDLIGNVIRTFDDENASYEHLAVSPDDQLLVLTQDSIISTWNMNGEKLQEISLPGEINHLKFTKDGKTMAVAAENSVYLLNADLEILNQVDFIYNVLNFEFSPSGKEILACTDNYTALLAPISESDHFIEFSSETEFMLHTAFSLTGDTIFSFSIDYIELWSKEAKLIGRRKLEYSAFVNQVRVSPTYNVFATIDFNSIRVFDFSGNLMYALKGHSTDVNDLAFSPDGKYFATASSDYTSRLYQLEGRNKKKIASNVNFSSQIKLTPDKLHMVYLINDTVYLYNTLSGKITKRYFTNFPYNIVFSPDSKYMLVGGAHGIIQQVALENYEKSELKSVEVSDMAIMEMAYSPSGNSFVVLLEKPDTRLILFNSNLEIKKELDFGTDVTCRKLDFADDETPLILGFRDLKKWNLSTNTLDTINTYSNGILQFKVSPNRELIVFINRDNSLMISDIDGNVYSYCYGHDGFIYSANFSSDNSKIVSSADDKTSRIWNTDGLLLQTLWGHTMDVYFSDFTSDDKHVISISADKSMRLWEMQIPIQQMMSNPIWNTLSKVDMDYYQVE